MKKIFHTLAFGLLFATSSTQASTNIQTLKQEAQELITQAQFLTLQGIAPEKVLEFFEGALTRELAHNEASAQTLQVSQKILLKKGLTIGACCLAPIACYFLGMLIAGYLSKNKLEAQRRQNLDEFTQLRTQHDEEQNLIHQRHRPEQDALRAEREEFFNGHPVFARIRADVDREWLDGGPLIIPLDVLDNRITERMITQIAQEAVARVHQQN